ncbi:MAG TPA: zf-HC2 domain-containing protein [Pyrinomonadaceae bacterium]|jgi:anti-sigma factor RsiW|nr:zf-HC2 domain-containing protein [Pyrinomonadaceae bacterium]
MKETDISSACERADELLSVLYGEASEREARDFELHLKQCAGCRAEFAAFGQVRESIGEWRDQALTGFVSSQPAMPDPLIKKSAVMALRQFFDLSPLWLKGAVGFAAVVFCVLAALAMFRPRPEVPAQVATVDRDAVYTQADVDHAVQQALAKQEEQRLVAPTPMVLEWTPNKSTVAKRERRPEAQRPFSRAEREQLAADLRLLSGDDDLDLELPGDQNSPR